MVYFGHILGISWAYLWHSWVYHEDWFSIYKLSPSESNVNHLHFYYNVTAKYNNFQRIFLKFSYVCKGMGINWDLNLRNGYSFCLQATLAKIWVSSDHRLIFTVFGIML